MDVLDYVVPLCFQREGMRQFSLPFNVDGPSLRDELPSRAVVSAEDEIVGRENKEREMLKVP